MRTLSEASSTGLHFEAFKDIAWNSPEFAAPADDPRWTLPAVDPLSHTDWYRTLPTQEQRRVARIRLASITKTGSQFEQLLLLGGTQFLMGLANENPEFRYFMHELTEQTHHIQMFQEFTNRVAPEVHGAPTWLVKAFPLVGSLGSLWPSFFFQIILAGEEPIDHIQKSIMRGGGIHPLTDRIMQIHLAEEARHIGFAHAWLRHHAPRMSRFNRLALGLTMPVVMRIGFWAIVVPSRQDATLLGIPRNVLRETSRCATPISGDSLQSPAQTSGASPTPTECAPGSPSGHGGLPAPTAGPRVTATSRRGPRLNDPHSATQQPCRAAHETP